MKRIITGLLFLLLTFTFVGCGKTTVDVNKYATVEVTGYNGHAKAKMNFDYEKFVSDYNGKIKQQKQSKNIDDMDELDLVGFFYDSAAEAVACELISGSFDNMENLSNGDTVTYTWVCEDEAAEEMFGCKLKYKDITTTVKDLEDIDSFDAFEGVSVEFDGIAPNGSASLITNNTYPEISYFLEEPTYELSNGDTVTVKLSNPSEEWYISQYHALPEKTELKITVQGLPEYVTSVADISDEFLNSAKAQAEDIINARVATYRGKAQNTTMEYIGNYFLTGKEGGYTPFGQNILYLVYKMHTDIISKNGSLIEAVDYYAPVYFYDIVRTEDGTISSDLSTSGLVSADVSRLYDAEDGWDFDTLYYFPGYEDIASMYEDCVTSDAENYNHEDNVVSPE